MMLICELCNEEIEGDHAKLDEIPEEAWHVECYVEYFGIEPDEIHKLDNGRN